MNTFFQPSNRLLIALSMALIGILLVKGIRVYFKNTSELLELINATLGGIGVLAAVWQTVLAVNASLDAKENDIQDALDSIREDSNERDLYHEKWLTDLQTQLASVNTQLEQHQNSLGHAGYLEQILLLKDQVSDLRATFAVYGDQLGRLEKDLEKIKLRS